VTLEGNVFRGEEAEFVTVQRVGYLATVRPDGRPHVVPISAVLDLDRLVFASERATRKIRNIEGNPNVALCFDEYHEDWAELVQVIAEGEAYIIDSGFEFERDRTLLYEKFPQYESEAPIEQGTTVIVEVRVDTVRSTWRSTNDSISA
jgi:PPOX class probable F420-dependent enzyme